MAFQAGNDSFFYFLDILRIGKSNIWSFLQYRIEPAHIYSRRVWPTPDRKQKGESKKNDLQEKMVAHVTIPLSQGWEFFVFTNQ